MEELFSSYRLFLYELLARARLQEEVGGTAAYPRDMQDGARPPPTLFVPTHHGSWALGVLWEDITSHATKPLALRRGK